MKIKPTQSSVSIPVPAAGPAWVWATVLAMIAFVLYANTLSNDFVLDDAGAVTNNLFVLKGFKGIPEILRADLWHFDNVNLAYYRPLSLITFAIEYQLFGKNPAVFHFGNILLFSLTIFFLFLLLQKILKEKHPAIPFLITLIFAAHPIHTEVVANIKSRDEILSFLNMILAFYLLLIYSESNKIPALVFAAFFFYLSLLSKETSTIGIFVIPVLLYFFGKADRDKMISTSAVFVGAAVLFFIQKKMMLGTLSGTVPDDIVNYPYMGTDVRIATSFLIFVYALKLLLFPFTLQYDYSYNSIPAGDWSDPFVIVGFLLILFLCGWMFYVFQKKTESHPKNRIYVFAGIFFMISIAPLMAFVLLRGGIFAERFLYAPSFGFCIALVSFCILLLKADDKNSAEKIPAWLKRHGVLSLLVFLIFTTFSFTTIQRNTVWKNNFTLFSTDVRNNENSAQNHRHFGSECINRAMTEKDPIKKSELFNTGISELRHALRIYPRFGDAFFKIGVAYQSVYQNADSLIYYYGKAIETAPGFAISYNNLGIYYQGQKKYELASYYYNKALEMNPNFPDAKRNTTALKAATGLDVHLMPMNVNLDSLAQHTEQKDDKFYYNMGTFYASQGNYKMAMTNLLLCIKMNPKHEDAWINLGNCYGVQGMYKESVEANLEVLKLNPGNQRALQNLALSYQNLGENAKADEVRAKLRELLKK